MTGYRLTKEGKLKKLMTGVAVLAVSLVAAAPAGADSGNGCGEEFRLGAGPGFGQSVSEAAKGTGLDEEVRLICRQIG